MVQILIRNIGEQEKLGLQMLAVSHGNSMEEEVRQIIRAALEKKRGGLGSQMADYFKGIVPPEFEVHQVAWGNVRNPFEGQ